MEAFPNYFLHNVYINQFTMTGTFFFSPRVNVKPLILCVYCYRHGMMLRIFYFGIIPKVWSFCRWWNNKDHWNIFDDIVCDSTRCWKWILHWNFIFSFIINSLNNDDVGNVQLIFIGKNKDFVKSLYWRYFLWQRKAHRN